MSYEVFISYSGKDLPFVGRTQTVLQEAGVSAFVAEHSVLPGSSLTDEIKLAISGCRLFLLLWSKDASQSGWVQRELGMATAQAKRVVPVVLDEEAILPAFLQDVKYIPAYEDMDAAMRSIPVALGGGLNARPTGLRDSKSVNKDRQRQVARATAGETDRAIPVILLVLGAILLSGGSK